MDAPRNFSWFVENKLAGMGYPKDEVELAYLAHKAGIKTLVNLTQTNTYVDQAEELGIAVHQIVIDDFCPPSLAQVQEFLSILDKSKEVSTTRSPPPCYALGLVWGPYKERGRHFVITSTREKWSTSQPIVTFFSVY